MLKPSDNKIKEVSRSIKSPFKVKGSHNTKILDENVKRRKNITQRDVLMRA